MNRCWLQGALGDALHALSCAVGYNIKWLLRAIARLGLGPVFCACCARCSGRRGLPAALGPLMRKPQRLPGEQGDAAQGR